MTDLLAKRLVGLAENDLADGTKVGAHVQVKAINSALDRAGITEPKQVNITVTPADQLFSDLESMQGGSRDITAGRSVMIVQANCQRLNLTPAIALAVRIACGCSGRRGADRW